MATLKNSQVLRAIPLPITIFSLIFLAGAKCSSGTRTPDHPCRIAAADDLLLLGESPEDYGQNLSVTVSNDLNPNPTAEAARYSIGRLLLRISIMQKRNFEECLFAGSFGGNGQACNLSAS